MKTFTLSLSPFCVLLPCSFPCWVRDASQESLDLLDPSLGLRFLRPRRRFAPATVPFGPLSAGPPGLTGLFGGAPVEMVRFASSELDLYLRNHAE